MAKKVIEVEMFDKNNHKIISKILDNKMVKGLAQVKRLDELEDDCYKMANLDMAIVEVMTKVAKNNNINGYIIIYNDFSGDIEKYNIN